jgi:hypothetical protein
MLNRRDFLKLSSMLAAGAVVTLSSASEILAWGRAPRNIGRHNLYFHGHSKSGCAFRPELVDLWSGGGAQLPDNL